MMRRTTYRYRLLHHCHYHPHRHFEQVTSAEISDGTAKPLHALSITSGSDPPVSFHNRLIAAYAYSGELSLARNLFDEMSIRNAVSYNSMLSAYARGGCMPEAFQIMSSMLGSGIRPTHFTFAGMLASPCSGRHHGAQLHQLMLKTGIMHSEAFSATALMGLFGRHGELDDVVKLFEEMPRRSVVTWNSVISVFANQGGVEDCMFLFRGLLGGEAEPTVSSFLSILSAIRSPGDYEYGEQVHSLAVRAGMDCVTMVANALIEMYSCLSNLKSMERLFSKLSRRDAVSWNTVIAAFSKSEQPGRSLELLLKMSFEGFSPTETTLASAISACASVELPCFGELVHGKTIKHNLERGEYVGTALVDFYAKHRMLDDADKLFNQIPSKTVASWNAFLSGHAINGSGACVALLKTMLKSELRPNEFSFSIVLGQSSIIELQQLHSFVLRIGYAENDYVSAATIAAYSSQGTFLEGLKFANGLVAPLPVASTNIIAGIYSRCGQYLESQKLLSHLQHPDGISWNILIAACSRHGDHIQAIHLLKHMLTNKIFPDKYIAVSLFSICSELKQLNLGSSFHGLIIKTCSNSLFDVFARNVLLDMYAKCGNLESSVRVFEEMGERNLISWTALITALGLHGLGSRALEMFKQMRLGGHRPDRVAFIAVLSACRHSGLVEEGMSLFRSMKSVYGVEPDMYHYIIVVDLLCKNGRLKEAENMISRMPFEPNATVWRVFLRGCRRIGERGDVMQ